MLCVDLPLFKSDIAGSKRGNLKISCIDFGNIVSPISPENGGIENFEIQAI